MQIEISKQVLLGALGGAVGVAHPKATMHVLAHVLLAVDQGLVRVQATDLQQGMSTTVTADSSHDGAVTAEAKKLYDLVRSLPGDTAKLVAAKGFLHISGGKVKYRIPTLPADSFPALPALPAGPTLGVNAATLGDLIGLTQYAMADNRPNLSGTLLECVGGVLRMVATDGHRLSKAERRLQEDVPECFNARLFVPRGGIAAIKRLADDAGDKPVELVRDAARLFVVAGETTLSVKLGDVCFPAYERILPAHPTTTVQVQRKDFVAALNRMRLVGEGVHLFFGQEDGLRITTSEAGGEGVDEIQTQHTGPAITIAFGASLLLETLGALELEEVALEFTKPMQPGLVRAPGFVGVVMPRRI